MLTERHHEIINILIQKGDWAKGKDIAKALNVTVRTIRSDIANMNEVAPGLVLSNTRKGYRVKESVYNSLPLNNNYAMPQTPEERKFFIIKSLLFEYEDISFYELQKLLYVSEYTIESDVRHIRKMLDSYDGLELVRNRNRIYFKGSEKVKRLFYRDVLRAEIESDFLNMNVVASLFNKIDLLSVTQTLEQVLNDNKYLVRKTSVPIIAIQIGVSLERMLMGHYVQLTEFEDEKKLHEVEVASDFYTRMSEVLSIEYHFAEIIDLARLLVMFNKSESPLNDSLYVDGHQVSVNDVINDVFNHILNVFYVDFRHDEDLRVGLHLHIQSLLIRAQNDVFIPNLYLEEIKGAYSLVFEMSVHASQIIANHLGIDVNESETAFIALHLGSAYERICDYSKYRVVLISSGNYTFSKKAEQKIQEKFKDKIEVIETLSYFEASEVEKYNADLIISFFPISHVLGIPTINISMFLNTQDEAKLFFAIGELERHRYSKEASNRFTTIIEEEHYHNLSGFTDKVDIIKYMTERLVELECVDENFCDSVLRREELASTSFVQGIAVPHPLFLKSNKSVIAVGALDKPVLWGSHEVELVLLLAINEKDNATFSLFFERLSMLLSDNDRMNDLKRSKTRDEFVKVMTS